MENELLVRRETVGRLESRILRLEGSVETAHRRIADLKQGAISARAIKREQQLQAKLMTVSPIAWPPRALALQVKPPPPMCWPVSNNPTNF